VKLAQALVHDPELLFLDEPTSGLDPTGRQEMLDLVAELPARRRCAIVLSTHLLPDVERLCDQVIVMHEGRLVFAGTVEELRGAAEPSRYEVRVKEGEDRLGARLVQAGCQVDKGPDGLLVRLGPGQGTELVFREARAAEVQVRHLAPLRATLEEAFLEAIQA